MAEASAKDISAGAASAPAKKGDRRASRKSGIFTKARMSFVRSHGERGADVETLRGTTGANYEGEAKVSRVGSSNGLCGCLGGSSGEPTKDKYMLIKGAACFVFSNEEASSPKYAIMLAHMKTDVDGATVVLETALGDASVAKAEQIKERLGHGQMLQRNKSVRYEQSIATKKENDQPE
ncbi:hypothetical protein ACHAWF_008005 [Thalassiosira exigua]